MLYHPEINNFKKQVEIYFDLISSLPLVSVIALDENEFKNKVKQKYLPALEEVIALYGRLAKLYQHLPEKDKQEVYSLYSKCGEALDSIVETYAYLLEKISSKKKKL
ncbi:MAG: hypothetical protein GXN99_00275 [Candidatus Nanohaloarchaeota archaeon]|nr:hypothetical protein [Candidatus Nanohaloarchaeota archaeon]